MNANKKTNKSNPFFKKPAAGVADPTRYVATQSV